MPEEKKKNRIFPIAGAAAAVVLVLAAVAILVFTLGNNPKKKAAGRVINELLSEPHDAAFISMFDIQGFSAEDFQTYRGLNTCIAGEYNPSDLKEMTAFLERFDGELKKKQEKEQQTLLSYLFIGINPERYASEEEISAFRDLIQNNYAGIQVNILLSPVKGRYILSLDDGRFDDIKNRYKNFVCAFDETDNVHVYFPGSALWLCANPSCFLEGSDYAPEKSVASKIMLYCFCDGAYEVGGPNINDALFEWSKNISIIKNDPVLSQGLDLSGHHAVFFGDSIVAHYDGPLSATGVLEAFSGAKSYNCGIGGMTLTDNADYTGLYGMLDYSNENAAEYKAKNEALGVRAVPEDLEESLGILTDGAFQGKRDVIIEFGLNDYQAGIPTRDFEKSLEKDLSYLSDHYAFDRILIIGPSYIFREDLDNGYGKMKNGGTLDEYRNILKNAAEKHNCLYLDLMDLPQDISLLESDGIHLNEDGRLFMGIAVAKSLSGQ